MVHSVRYEILSKLGHVASVTHSGAWRAAVQGGAGCEEVGGGESVVMVFVAMTLAMFGEWRRRFVERGQTRRKIGIRRKIRFGAQAHCSWLHIASCSDYLGRPHCASAGKWHPTTASSAGETLYKRGAREEE